MICPMNSRRMTGTMILMMISMNSVQQKARGFQRQSLVLYIVTLVLAHMKCMSIQTKPALLSIALQV